MQEQYELNKQEQFTLTTNMEKIQMSYFDSLTVIANGHKECEYIYLPRESIIACDQGKEYMVT